MDVAAVVDSAAVVDCGVEEAAAAGDEAPELPWASTFTDHRPLKFNISKIVPCDAAVRKFSHICLVTINE